MCSFAFMNWLFAPKSTKTYENLERIKKFNNELKNKGVELW